VTRGSRESRAILAAALVVVVTLAAFPAIGAAKQKPGGRPASTAGLFGTTIWEPPTGEEYQRMVAGGISHMKLLFSASLIAPQPSTRDWRLYDQIVGDAARSGVTMDPWLFGSPSWMSANPVTLPVGNPAQVQFWSSLVHDAAQRYGPGGQFWAENPMIPARPMRDWEVWNEPNINEMTGVNHQAKVSEYARLLVVTRAALKQANPENRVVLGGLYRRPRPGHGIRMTRFLERLYKLKKGRSLFDVVAIHPYAARPRQVLSVSRSVRRVMNAHRDARKALWITELGWTTGGSYWSQSLYRATLAQQAARVAGSARLLLANRRRLRLRRVDWHTWRDMGGGAGSFWDRFMGLFSADGQPKPAWAAFTSVTGGFAGGQIRNVGHFAPWGTPPPPGGSGSGSKPTPAPSNPPCLLPGILC
jgi:polysaccharide biosynthesis protein PslG